MALCLGSWIRAPRSMSLVVGILGEDPGDPKRRELDIVELSRPRFDSVPYTQSNPETLNPRLIQPHVKPAKFWKPQRGWGKPYKKPSPQQSMTGSVLGALCSAGVYRAVTASYNHLTTHPVAHNVPFGLTDSVNQALETTVLGLGWLAICLFAASSVGLALLSVKLQAASSSSSSSSSSSRESTWAVMISFLVILSCATSNVEESFSSTAPEAFQRSCMGCHARGGNILQAGATLSSEDLQRNGVSSVEDIFRITYYGKGRMPGFGEGCKPQGQCTFASRLSNQDIQALAEFVKSQADQGWHSIK